MSKDRDFEGVVCPHCQSDNNEVLSLFGGSSSEVLFKCSDCDTCFNWLKWRGALPTSALDYAKENSDAQGSTS